MTLHIARIFFGLAAWIAVSQCARAADDTLPASWSRDEPGGRYADVAVPTPCGDNSMTTKVTMERFNPDRAGRNFPTARIILSTRAVKQVTSDPQQSAILEISADINEKIPHAHFSRRGNGQTFDDLDLGAIPLGAKAALALSWSDNGKVTASVNDGEKFSILLMARPRSLGLSISGARASFDEIRNQSAGEISPNCGKP